MTTKEASTHYGSQLALARALGIWPTAVSQWGESPPLLRQYQILPQTIWEPACGAGAISKRLSNRGYHVQSSDLNNHGFGAWGVDFLDAEERLADAIVPNPPFSLAEAFIYKADTLGVQYMALVLKAHFWHAKRRTALFAQWQPARFYAMNWRPQFGAGSSPAMDFIWCVWDRRTPGPTTYSILEKRT